MEVSLGWHRTAPGYGACCIAQELYLIEDLRLTRTGRAPSQTARTEHCPYNENLLGRQAAFVQSSRCSHALQRALAGSFVLC